MNGRSNLQRVLTICLGGLWLLDGILQLQPAMFTSAFISAVLAPNLQNQPSVAGPIILFGIHIFSFNIFWSNLAAALIQLAIGALLVFPFRRDAGRFDAQRFGLWLSVVWALIVWIFGEGFGNVFTGSATFYTGAPGSALLYAILSLALLYSFHKRLPLLAGILFLAGAGLNLVPMFWRPTMLSMLAVSPGISGALGTFGAQGTMVGNFIAVDVLIVIGIFLLLVPNRAAAWTAIVFLAIVWAVGQDFGLLQTFPSGTATDPNSAPLLILFLLPIFFAPRTAATTPPSRTSPR